MAKKKIYVSPSDQINNKYAVGGTTEAVQCRKIAKALVSALKRCDFDAMTNTTGNMQKRVAESDKYGADLHLPIHTNAHNKKVKGTRLFSYDLKGEGYKACKAIMAALAPITPGSSDSITARKTLYEIRKPKAPTAYIEVAFHDNTEEARWIVDNTDAIAEAICKGVCKHFAQKYVPPVTEQAPEQVEAPKAEKEDLIYRVFNSAGKQVGAYAEESNAFNEVKRQLQADGKATITLGKK